MDNQMQTREEAGCAVRSRTHADITNILRRAPLTAWQRTQVLEVVEQALTADRREALGAAQVLTRAAAAYEVMPAVSATLDCLASAFVRDRTTP
jgi:hypothetical protein